jgi:two-component system, OmpR family, osmolarity sensor histidine kinase EnvZ
VQSAFNRMAGDLASMERERAMVLAGISHDLRTPLSRLRLAVEMSGADAAAAQGMNADIEEMDQVIGQFLDFARGDAEAREPVALDALADEVAAHFAKLGKPVRRTGTSGVTLPAARMALHRALMNLVDNALRHGGGEIEIAASRNDGGAILAVFDRGPGIPAGEVERLKRPFTRLDEARSGQGGSGLGLAIVERVAHAHGGRFELAPREGGGLAARLVLGAGA